MQNKQFIDILDTVWRIRQIKHYPEQNRYKLLLIKNRGSTVDCKICQKQHTGTDNVYYITYTPATSSFFLNCMRDDSKKGVRYPVTSIASKQKLNTTQQIAICKKLAVKQIDSLQKYVGEMEHLITDRIDYNDHLKDSETVYIVKAAMGVGKTSQLLKYIAESKSGMWIYISYRKSLTAEICTKARQSGIAVYDYQTYDKKNFMKNIEGSDSACMLVVQWESLDTTGPILKAIQQRQITGNLIVDEYVSVLEQITSSVLVKKKKSCLLAMVNYTICCSKTILMDANVDQRHIEIWKQQFHVDSKQLKMLWYTQLPSIIKRVHMMKNNQLLPHMIDYLNGGDRCCYVSNIKSECEMMYAALGGYSKGIVIVTGDDDCRYRDMPHDNMIIKQMLFEDIDRFLQQHDVKCLIYSPCISAGCSIESQQYKRVYAFFSNQSNSAMSACQQLGRTRAVTDIYMNVVNGVRQNIGVADDDVILRNM